MVTDDHKNKESLHRNIEKRHNLLNEKKKIVHMGQMAKIEMHRNGGVYA